jgi:uncharacterized membrane protein YkoI
MKRTRLAALALTTPLALALVACGSDDDGDDDAGTDVSTVQPTDGTSSDAADAPATSDPATSEAPTSDASTDDAPGADPGEPPVDALRRAAATAADAAGGTVFSVDEDGGLWEVSVVTDDGTEYDVRVSADGATVQGEPVEDRDDADDAARDRDERLRLLDAAVGYEAAIDAAAPEAGGAEPDSVELDEENGVATWEVTFAEDTSDEVTVFVDAASGEVTGTELDD